MKIFLFLLLFPLLLQAQERFQGRVVGVSDGDTLKVLVQSPTGPVEKKIRLLGIDAPEKKQAFGEKAKYFLSGLVFQKEVEVLSQKKDRYGRILGKIFFQGQDINLTLVAAGYAWHYSRYAKDQEKEDQKRYAAAMREAKEKQLGLWSDPGALDPENFRRQEKHKRSLAGKKTSQK